MEATIRTRLLILSDTNGEDFSCSNRPHQRVDVVLHCGDLTDGTKLDEFRTSITMLESVDAPLKLVIAGNHDFTMDIDAFEAKLAEAVPSLEPELVAREYGTLGLARQLFEDARNEGIVFLDEGTHHIPLTNGAVLKLYAGPYTPALGLGVFNTTRIRVANSISNKEPISS
jgi:Calcineurin-like phosphoesterase